MKNILKSLSALFFVSMFIQRVDTIAVAQSADSPRISAPSDFLGFDVGADRKLADYRQIRSYFKMLASSSKRIEIEVLGPTTLGEEMIQAVISSEENLKNKARYQEIARKLADPRGLSSSEISALARDGKAIVLVTCNIHASEIGSTQMSMEWAHALVTSEDPETKRRLNEVILLLVPSLNPDGQIMETEWYRKNLGTQHEGGRLPWLYHHYVGHDNNRDWYMLTQKEAKAMNRAVFFEWHPQVWLDEHQMGSNGPRIFVPPFASPVASSLNPIIWRVVDHIGSMMAWRLEEQNKSGVISNFSYDAYWPGGTMNTAWWKNVFGLLTEVASVKLATPVDVSAGELSGGRKGLIDYRQQTSFPNPWPGGEWRLRDIMDYERIASDALLEICATNRVDILHNSSKMSLDAVHAGTPNESYKISTQQRDPYTAAKLAHLIRENGAEVLVSADKKIFYIPTAQPFSKFLSEVLGIQRYPKVKLTAGTSALPPYDVTAWSLPLMMGVEVEKAKLTSDELKGLRAITDSDWPEGTVDKAGASLYAVSHESNSVTKLINDVLKRKATVSLAREGFEANGISFPAGSVLLEGISDAGTLAKSYAVQLHGLSEKPKVQSDKLREVHIGLYKPWLASMDEGWTRWLLEQYNFSYKNIDNKAIKAGKQSLDVDVIVLPDVDKETILEGKPRREEGQMKYFEELPPDYSGGIGKDGSKNLRDFVEKGGTLLALASASDFVIDEFNVPVNNILARARPDDFNCPGSLLRVNIDPTHPVTYGLPNEVAAFVNERIAFQTTIPGSELSRKVLGWYPEDAEDVLLSGWIHGAERLERRAAVVALSYGKGKIVLLGFRVQHRAQTEGTYKLLFNALQWAGMVEGK